jgi:hypothetical protein
MTPTSIQSRRFASRDAHVAVQLKPVDLVQAMI